MCHANTEEVKAAGLLETIGKRAERQMDSGNQRCGSGMKNEKVLRMKRIVLRWSSDGEQVAWREIEVQGLMGMVRGTDEVTQMKEELKPGRNEKRDNSIWISIGYRGKKKGERFSVVWKIQGGGGEQGEEWKRNVWRQKRTALLIYSIDAGKISRLSVIVGVDHN